MAEKREAICRATGSKSDIREAVQPACHGLQSPIFVSLDPMERIRALLEQLRDQLSAGGEHRFAGDVDAALASCDDAVAAFVMSDELWGGAGSIVDQALGGRSPARRQLEQLLIELGREQIARGHRNARTEIWISVFHEWHTQNI